MSFAISSSEPELWFLIPSQEEAVAVPSHRCVMERREARRSAPLRKGARHGEHMQQRRPGTGTSRGQGSTPTPPGYFSVELVIVLLFVAASLVFLPLVLPPLSPPPFLLLLVPVGLLAVLVAMAFVPLDAQSHLVRSSRL
ncbi:uncharacterized protein LOC133910191 [Phragmites australis]|uniref:uncharacterized protein LOC133910191 n=1 Tax=Phragmites australis TaxID=29695 RepID=UPI002D791373|nr:uncharacterized protein LOC133910191 [Phragmites australis]